MIRQVVDRREVQRYVEAVREQLDDPRLKDAAAHAASTFGDPSVDPVAKLRAALPAVEPELASSAADAANVAPFMSRDPIQSLLQSVLESKLRERGVPDEESGHRGVLAWLIHLIESILHPVRYGPDDPDWVIDVAASMLERLAEGTHRFNPLPAEHEIADDARIVIVGDWGSGVKRAQEVAKVIAEEVADALAHGREAHVVHLGDIYYSGTEEEVRRHVLAAGMWPVTVEQADAGVTSWSLNGNHDMYGGGFGYFQTLLGDRRFEKQRSPDNEPTSFFRLRSPSWDFVALDTSWNKQALSIGFIGVLEDPQLGFAERVAGESERKLMLLSHHQPVSVYDPEDIGTFLPKKLAPVLSDGRVTAWLWGHEHRCMGFEEHLDVKFPRCLGHGGVPVLMEHKPNEPVPPPGLWEERGFSQYRGDHWGRMGCAILDLDGERIEVHYRDEEGTTTREETIV
jgi:hypothetical protein